MESISMEPDEEMREDVQMIVADGGSTKCQWAIITAEGTKYAETQGVNPTQMTKAQMVELMQKSDIVQRVGVSTPVYYYGAGCIAGEPSERMTSALREVTGSGNINVMSDMLGAARSMLGTSKGVACILGTGCNSCSYDGRKIVRSIRPLGYILGDEGSGADIGKHILADGLKGFWDQELTDKLHAFAAADYNTIIKNIYSQPRANAYLASFVRFASDNIDCEEIRNIVSSRLSCFIERNVSRYEEDALSGGVSFTGGVASQFENILREVCGAKGIKVRTIASRPIDGMVRYHKQK